MAGATAIRCRGPSWCPPGWGLPRRGPDGSVLPERGPQHGLAVGAQRAGRVPAQVPPVLPFDGDAAALPELEEEILGEVPVAAHRPAARHVPELAPLACGGSPGGGPSAGSGRTPGSPPPALSPTLDLVGAVAEADAENVVDGAVGIEQVGAAVGADEAVLAPQHQHRAVDQLQGELLILPCAAAGPSAPRGAVGRGPTLAAPRPPPALTHGVADGRQLPVPLGADVAAVAGAQGHAPPAPLDLEQRVGSAGGGRRP